MESSRVWGCSRGPARRLGRPGRPVGLQAALFLCLLLLPLLPKPGPAHSAPVPSQRLEAGQRWVAGKPGLLSLETLAPGGVPAPLPLVAGDPGGGFDLVVYKEKELNPFVFTSYLPRGVIYRAQLAARPLPGSSVELALWDAGTYRVELHPVTGGAPGAVAGRASVPVAASSGQPATAVARIDVRPDPGKVRNTLLLFLALLGAGVGCGAAAAALRGPGPGGPPSAPLFLALALGALLALPPSRATPPGPVLAGPPTPLASGGPWEIRASWAPDPARPGEPVLFRLAVADTRSGRPVSHALLEWELFHEEDGVRLLRQQALAPGGEQRFQYVFPEGAAYRLGVRVSPGPPAVGSSHPPASPPAATAVAAFPVVVEPRSPTAAARARALAPLLATYAAGALLGGCATGRRRWARSREPVSPAAGGKGKGRL